MGLEGCHRWKYALHWDRPSRLATLKNALGSSVTIYRVRPPAPARRTTGRIRSSRAWTGPATRPPGTGTTPRRPRRPTTAAYDHDCDNAVGPACAGPKPGDPDGEHPGIWYTIGPADGAGEIVDWSWTLNYGYAKAPANDIVFGLDPGPPLDVYDLTVDTTGLGPTGLGGSIPGITGTPKTFPTTLTTRGGSAITAPTKPGVDGLNQPRFETDLPSDVVGNSRNQVNWGLMTYQDASPFDERRRPRRAWTTRTTTTSSSRSSRTTAAT